MHLHEEVNLESVAEQLPQNFTGADFSALTSEAYMNAVQRKIADIDAAI